uniref:DUF4200 domain-containing protein n=1 Tax=Oreochromis aureus TaxID=47969 RepID=A0A668UWG3_OREAU
MDLCCVKVMLLFALCAQEMRKFLALPIDEKTTHAARVTAKLKNELVGELEDEEEEEKKGGNEKMKNLKPIKSRTSGFIFFSSSFPQLSVMTKRSEILRMDEAIAKEEKLLKHLERSIERDNVRFEEFLRENEKKSVEARTLYEQEARSTQEKNTEIRRLTAEILTIKSELARFEEILVDYKRYKDLLFKLSPPEWQDAQRSKVMSGKGAKEDQNRELKDTAIRNGKLSPAHSDSLSSLNISPQVEETLEQLQQIHRCTKLHSVTLTGPRNHFAYLQDVLLDALSEKVAEVHCSCVDDRVTNLNTLEKLANIEKRLSLLLQSIESIPEEKLESMKKIKDSERRTRYCVPQWLNVPLGY